jgi:flagellar biosynthesis/type III secretory pathway protein FliH
MSSSDRLERARLPRLGSEALPVRRDEFTPGAGFARTASGKAPPLSADEAYQTGLVEGERRGREAALKEIEPARQELQALARSMAVARRERIEQAERELTDVAVQLARQILRGELQQGGDVVVRMARSCIEAARHEGDVLTLRVAPADLDLIRTHLPELEVDLADCSLRAHPDPSIPRGSIVLETRQRCYEGRPERILDAIARNVARAEDGA